ncbi:probable G-protein coupled receptor 139 [Gigantopelta aegis]|uniref:probable G-protein coupled receptor 139 n=1 Tax=Gigantopelta aegis TaxID=1735272 RepID=UPI001B889DF5|nr:probable G-protein coupled receptor 139 [Gigantopelta aegis]
MSTPSPFWSNQTSNFTERDDGFDEVGFGKGDFKMYHDNSTLNGWPYFNLHGYAHWAIILSIVIAGTIGNIMLFIMVSDSKLASLSYTVYLKFMAFCDCLALIVGMYLQTEEYFNLPKLANMSNTIIKIVIGFEFLPTFLSPWLVVGFTLDRFVCVCFPLKREIFCTRKKAIAVCSCMVAATIVLVIPILDISELVMSDNLVYYIIVFRMVLSSTLPCIIILVLNIFITVRIKRGNEFRSTFIRHSANPTKDSSTRPLVLISVLAFVTLLPMSVSDIINLVSYLLEAGREVVIITDRLWPALNIIYSLNLGQNFFILIGSSQNYRQIIKRKLRCFTVKGRQTRPN